MRPGHHGGKLRQLAVDVELVAALAGEGDGDGGGAAVGGHGRCQRLAGEVIAAAAAAGGVDAAVAQEIALEARSCAPELLAGLAKT